MKIQNYFYDLLNDDLQNYINEINRIEIEKEEKKKRKSSKKNTKYYNQIFLQ